MAITEVRIKDIDYLKIYRQWGKKNHIKYLPLPAGAKAQEKTWAKARTLDEEMAHQQALYRAGKALQVSSYLREDGRVVGITRSRSANGIDEFRASVWDNVKRKQLRAKASIPERGVLGAYLLVLDRWIDFRHLELDGPVHQALKAGYNAYLLPEEKTALEEATREDFLPPAQSPVDEFESALQSQVDNFLRKRAVGVRTR